MEHVDQLDVFQRLMDENGIVAAVTRINDEPGRIDQFIRYFLLNTYETGGRWVEEARIEVESWARSHRDSKALLARVRTIVEDAHKDPQVRRAYVDEGMREDPSGEDGWDRYSFRIRLQTRNVT